MKPRVAAARTLAELLQGKGSLSSALPPWQNRVDEGERALLQQLCYGTMRYYPRLDAYLGQLVKKPLRGKDADVTALILLGLYQLEYTRIPDHAALGETVGAARALKKPWATKLINGVLRAFQRQKAELDQKLAGNRAFQTAHPHWLLKALEKAWPDALDEIIEANNAHPPFTLRLDTHRVTREAYREQLAELELTAEPTRWADTGLTLSEARHPAQLPGFDDGLISVQDEAAQLAAGLLALAPGQRVLDACAAPGGKTGHIGQSEPELAELWALDSEERRLGKVHDNLRRLGVGAKVRCGDATRPDEWWDGKAFDRILLDAPCSASGIVRRHSDIKLLRQSADIKRLARLQGELLDALWPLLTPGGRLVYATCSALPAENTQVVEAFLKRQPEASHCPIEADWGRAQPAGRQLLPSTDGCDGFYYAVLEKPIGAGRQ